MTSTSSVYKKYNAPSTNETYAAHTGSLSVLSFIIAMLLVAALAYVAYAWFENTHNNSGINDTASSNVQQTNY